MKNFAHALPKLDNQMKSGCSKTVDSETVLKNIEANSMSSTLEYQTSSASDSSACFVAFTTTIAKASEAGEFCLTYFQNIAKFLTHPEIFFLSLGVKY